MGPGPASGGAGACGGGEREGPGALGVCELARAGDPLGRNPGLAYRKCPPGTAPGWGDSRGKFKAGAVGGRTTPMLA
eukprot:scaffold158089_cov18-Tisochrysis_lutea.AAC.1